MPLVFLYPPGGEALEDVEVEQGKIRGIDLNSEPYEVSVDFRGMSYHMIFGSQCNGNFICIPTLHVGAELARYEDMAWNQASLEQCGLASDMAEMFARCLCIIQYYLGVDND